MDHGLGLLLSCFFIVFSSLFIFSEAQLAPALFMFGDSLVDVGNNNHLKLSLAKADFPHNGVDFPGKKPTGRFCNGKNAADFLAEKLGLPSAPPYLSLISKSKSSNASFVAGVSFASGGAGIFDGTDALYKQSLPLKKQVDYYATVYERLVQQLGSAGAQEHLSKSVFAVVIGSNDILGYYGSDSSTRNKTAPQQFVDSMAATLKEQLKYLKNLPVEGSTIHQCIELYHDRNLTVSDLLTFLKRMYNLGARKFAMVGVGAVGCCPSQRNKNSTEECSEEANYWSVKYNERLKSLLQELISELKGMSYSYFDTYSVMLNLIQKPAAYGFKEVKAACCGLGNLNADFPCLPISTYCSNRKDHIFWDLYHPTEAAASIVVQNIFNGTQEYTFPMNLRQLVAA